MITITATEAKNRLGEYLDGRKESPYESKNPGETVQSF